MSKFNTINISNSSSSNLQIGDNNTMTNNVVNLSSEDKKLLSYSNIELLIDERIESFKAVLEECSKYDDIEIKRMGFKIEGILADLKVEIKKESESVAKNSDEFKKSSIKKKKTIIENILGLSKMLGSTVGIAKNIGLLGPYIQGTVEIFKPILDIFSEYII